MPELYDHFNTLRYRRDDLARWLSKLNDSNVPSNGEWSSHYNNLCGGLPQGDSEPAWSLPDFNTARYRLYQSGGGNLVDLRHLYRRAPLFLTLVAADAIDSRSPIDIKVAGSVGAMAAIFPGRSKYEPEDYSGYDLYDDVISIAEDWYSLEAYLKDMDFLKRRIAAPTAERRAAEDAYATHAGRLSESYPNIARLFKEALQDKKIIHKCMPHGARSDLEAMIEFGPELNALAATYYDIYGSEMRSYPQQLFEAITRLHGERNMPT